MPKGCPTLNDIGARNDLLGMITKLRYANGALIVCIEFDLPVIVNGTLGLHESLAVRRSCKAAGWWSAGTPSATSPPSSPSSLPSAWPSVRDPRSEFPHATVSLSQLVPFSSALAWRHRVGHVCRLAASSVHRPPQRYSRSAKSQGYRIPEAGKPNMVIASSWFFK